MRSPAGRRRLLRRALGAGCALLAVAVLATGAVAGAPDGKPSIPEIAVADLPPEGRETIRLIKRGGPFPHARDGVLFGNYERLLPRRKKDYYREYTVITPGAGDRGARRIVAGAAGELYYTGDHYRSFKRIRE